MLKNLLNNVKITRVLNRGAGTASATANKGTIIDMSGFRSVMFVAAFDNVLVNSVVTLGAGLSDANDTAQMTAMTSGTAGGTATATSFDNKLVVLDLVAPKKRYIEAQLTCATADGPYDGVIAIQYDPINVPTTQSSTVVASATTVEP